MDIDLSRLKNLFDINIDVGDIDVTLINVNGGDKLSKEGEELRINTVELDEHEKVELKDLIEDTHERADKTERIFDKQEEEIAGRIEEGYTEEVFETLDYFDDVLFEKHYEILRQSLDMRTYIEQSNPEYNEIQQIKYQIAEESTNPDMAIYISSLCTSGYFDKEGGIRDLHVKMKMNNEYNQHNFKREFKKIVENRLLCVFIRSQSTAYEVTNQVRGALRKYKKKDPVNDYIDIRGINCDDLIDEMLLQLEVEHPEITYDEFTDGNETVVRVRPDSIE
jgi:hypothetical protein